VVETAQRKSHPLEGSRQEATPLPSTTFDIFSRCVLLGTLHPRLASPTQPCFHCRGVDAHAPHQSPIRIKAFWCLAVAPDICPWHLHAPENPRFPTVSNSVQRTDHMAPSRVQL